MKAKIYIGAKKYALYIGKKIVEKTLEFLTLPARFVSNKVQDLKNLTMWGKSVQTPVRTRNLFDKNSTPLDAYVINKGVVAHPSSKTWVIEVKPNTTYTLSYDNSMVIATQRCYIVGFENEPAIGSTDATAYYTDNNAKKHTITFTTDNNINYIALWLVFALGVEGIQEALSTAQLEEGNTATPYVPYIATTPTPNTPIPVESVGDKTSNLFDGEWEYGNIDATGVVIISTSPAAWVHGKNRIKVKPNTRYWFRFFGDVTRTSAQFYIIEYDKDDKFITGKCVSVGSIIFNVDGNYYDTSSNTEYIRFFYYHSVEESTSLDTDRYKLSIEERRDVIPSFEPYGYKVPIVVGDTTTNIYLNEPLRKIDEYSDYIDLESQKVVRNICETKPTSYQKGALAGSHYRFSTRISNIKIPVSIQDRFLILSDKYIADLTPTSYSETTSQYAITGYTGTNQVYIYDKDLDNEQSKTTDIDCLIYYIQETPTEETIDLPTINLPQGTLTIDTSTNVKPSKIEITGDIDNE